MQENWATTVDGFQYEVNVCRPLVDVGGTDCPRDAGACQVKNGTVRTYLCYGSFSSTRAPIMTRDSAK